MPPKNKKATSFKRWLFGNYLRLWKGYIIVFAVYGYHGIKIAGTTTIINQPRVSVGGYIIDCTADERMTVWF